VKSIKKIVTILGALLIIILISSSLFTLVYYRTVFENLDDFSYTLDNTKSTYIEMDLPIKVINNVILQLESSNSIEIERLERLMAAYETNHNYLLDKITTLKT